MSTNTLTLRDTITPRTEKWIRISAVMAMVIVAASSAILSFDGLQKLALASRVPEHLAFLFPIAVDTTILMGSLAVLLYELVGVRSVFGWFTVLFGTVLSVTGNVISVNDAGIIAQVLHGIIPILLCISLESLLRILRFNIQRSNKALEMEYKGTQKVEFDKPVTPVEITKAPETPPSPDEKVMDKGSAPVAEFPVTPKDSESMPAQPVPEPETEPAPVPEIACESVPVEETPVFESMPAEAPAVEVESSPVEESVVVPEKPAEAPHAVVEPVPAEEPKKAPSKPAPKRTTTRKPPEKAPAKKAPVKRAPAKKTVAVADEATATVAEPTPVPENVEKYKEFLGTLPTGKTRREKALEVKRKFPEATVTDIKAAVIG